MQNMREFSVKQPDVTLRKPVLRCIRPDFYELTFRGLNGRHYHLLSGLLCEVLTIAGRQDAMESFGFNTARVKSCLRT